MPSIAGRLLLSAQARVLVQAQVRRALTLEQVRGRQRELRIPPDVAGPRPQVRPGGVDPDGLRELDAGPERVQPIGTGEPWIPNPPRFPPKPHTPEASCTRRDEL